MRHAHEQASLRGDIQGLRAVAVMLVLLFHVWPALLPGGYIGVDVFFVISGYLIVGSLAREAEQGHVSLANFYSRRIRRLLPAASVVLAFSVIGTLFWLTQARWEDTLFQTVAAALYIENWYLAWAAVDYLAAENSASPVQHYWSLSIEEQFYIAWPIVMLASIWLGKCWGAPTRLSIGTALVLVLAASLGMSVHLSDAQPERAYFVTNTRAWELALGGLLAVWLPRITASHEVRACLFGTGLTAILISAFTFGGVDFPGYLALFPTIGAAFVILAGDFRVGTFRGLNAAPMRYVGDISYSLYLWHWPIIIFYLATGRKIDLLGGALLLLVTLAVSHASYHLIEQRFRDVALRSDTRPLWFGLSSTAAVVIVVGLLHSGLTTQSSAVDLDQAHLYPGPAALVDNAPVPSNVPLKPAVTQLLRDRAIVYDDGCHQDQQHSEAIICEYGDPAGRTKVAIVGSSHSVNWLPAFDVLGKRNGWKVFSITKSACAFRTMTSTSCNAWHENVLAHLARSQVDVVIIGEYADKTTTEAEQQVIKDRWQRIADLNIPILALRPIPHLETRPDECLPDNNSRCIISRAAAERANTIELAAKTIPSIHVIDMNDAICAREFCGPTVGNIVVYRDKHHLTATYAAAMAPFIERRLAGFYPHLLPIRDAGAQPTEPDRRRSARLKCNAIGPGEAFERTYVAMLSGDTILVRRGDWRARKKHFEVWEGVINQGAVTISGSYIEGGPDVKPLRFSGRIDGSGLVAAGQRGPRSCTVSMSTEGAGSVAD